MEKRKYYPLTGSQVALAWVQTVSLEPSKVREYDVITFYFLVPKNCNLMALEKAYNRLRENHDAFQLRFKYRYHYTPQIFQYFTEYKPVFVPIEEVKDREEFNSVLAKRTKWKVPLLKKTVDPHLFHFNDGTNAGALVIRINHFIADGYSVNLMLRELEHNYKLFAQGEDVPKPAKTYSILEYMNAYQEYVHSKQRKDDIRYWIKKFGQQHDFCFPVGRRAHRCEVGTTSLTFDGGDYSAILSMCRDQFISMQSFFMSAAALTIYRMTGRKNFALVSLTHGRKNFKLKQTVGCMMNNIPIFYKLDPSLSVRQFLKNEYEEYLEVLSHGDISMSIQLFVGAKEIVKHLDPNFNWLVFSQMEFGNLKAHSEYEVAVLEHTNLPHQMYCGIIDYPGKQVRVVLDYQKRRFKGDRIPRMVENFRHVVLQMLENPDAPIGSFFNLEEQHNREKRRKDREYQKEHKLFVH